jgi:hypothetical protein
MSSNEVDFAVLSLANSLTKQAIIFNCWELFHEIKCFVTVIALQIFLCDIDLSRTLIINIKGINPKKKKQN